jgi:hypothetical protein
MATENRPTIRLSLKTDWDSECEFQSPPLAIENIYTEFYRYTFHDGMVLNGLSMLDT